MGEFLVKYIPDLYWYSNSNTMRYNNYILKANIRHASWKVLETILLSQEAFLYDEFNQTEATLLE